MSQIPPAYSMTPPNDMDSASYAQPRWSALAITAFVLSLVGFLGVTAILGIILGIAGILVTRGGKRRGRGLAIAALPISVVMGLVFLFILCGLYQIAGMMELSRQTEKMLTVTDESSPAVTDFYARCSPSFREAVSEDQLKTWLTAIHRKHGSLTGFEQISGSPPITKDAGTMTFHYQGKFTNLPALVDLRFRFRSLTQPEVDDIEIDGVSPRPAEKS